METYTKDALSDITYKSELILDIVDVKDLIRRRFATTYVHVVGVSCLLI